MKLEKQIEDFIQLRIEGKSFDEIAKELKTSKSTLIAWNKKVDVRNEITEGRAIKINSLVKTFQFDLQSRLNTYMQLSKKINDELLQRDLSEVSTDKLLQMSLANDGRVKELINNNIRVGRNPYLMEVGEDADGFFNMMLDE
jgi:hypothetical protein